MALKEEPAIFVTPVYVRPTAPDICPAQFSADVAEQALVIYLDRALQEAMAAND